MKAAGITRKLDSLGRVVLPIELRRVLGIEVKDPLEIFTENDAIILKKYTSHKACMLTGDVSDKNITLFDGKMVLSREGAELLMKELSKSIEK